MNNPIISSIVYIILTGICSWLGFKLGGSNERERQATDKADNLSDVHETRLALRNSDVVDSLHEQFRRK